MCVMCVRFVWVLAYLTERVEPITKRHDWSLQDSASTTLDHRRLIRQIANDSVDDCHRISRVQPRVSRPSCSMRHRPRQDSFPTTDHCCARQAST